MEDKMISKDLMHRSFPFWEGEGGRKGRIKK